jgi:hypothetical protein
MVGPRNRDRTRQSSLQAIFAVGKKKNILAAFHCFALDP